MDRRQDHPQKVSLWQICHKLIEGNPATWHKSRAIYPKLLTYLPARRFHQGDVRNAILFACGANAGHGLRRTNADKRRAVMTLLNDEEWGQWSDTQIAKRCGVSQQFVSGVRPKDNSQSLLDKSPRKAVRNGKEYKVATVNIGKTPKPTQQP